MAILNLYNFGAEGVNVDASDLHCKDGELRQAQNVIHNTLGVMGGITNRPGLSRFNATAAAGSILGGISVPIANEDGERHLFIGANAFTEA
jgi:hypothetical protein